MTEGVETLYQKKHRGNGPQEITITCQGSNAMLTAETVRCDLVEIIRGRLATDQGFLEWAILEIDARQTDDEREDAETRYQNGRGWNYHDAGFGSYLASYIRGGRRPMGKRLSGEFVIKARNLMRKYAGQVLRVAAAAAPLKPTEAGAVAA